MKKITVLIIIFLFGYLYFGVEIIGKEHSTIYDPFIKKHPTPQFTFRNMVKCGECDFREYESLWNEHSKKEFRDLCYYRYGLEDISQCEDLFRH